MGNEEPSGQQAVEHLRAVLRALASSEKEEGK